MKKPIILIVFLMSCHNFVAAQHNFEWQIKMGIYSDFFKYPSLNPALTWRIAPFTTWGTVGIGIHIKKWRTLAQINFDTKITMKQSNFAWQKGFGDVVRISPNTIYNVKEGDYHGASFYYFNPVNILYSLKDSDKRFRVYLGLGVTGRYEVVDTIRFLNGQVWDVLGYFERLRFMPSLKAELQYTFGKRFFLSTHANYTYFSEEPNHYLQLAFNTGLRF
jgi:hypothetical protein